MNRFLKKGILVVFLWFIIHSTVISVDGLKDDIRPSDAGLIYGNKVEETGIMSERLKARIDKGLDLYTSGQVKKLIVSGGLGKEGFYEAQVMKKYLVGKGVPEEDVLVDDLGADTYASTLNYIEMAKKYKFASVIVISQFYHISRSKMILRKKGVENVYGAHADYFEWRDLYSLIREFPGYYSYLLK